jgi:hypothetical protein
MTERYKRSRLEDTRYVTAQHRISTPPNFPNFVTYQLLEQQGTL